MDVETEPVRLLVRWESAACRDCGSIRVYQTGSSSRTEGSVKEWCPSSQLKVQSNLLLIIVIVSNSLL